MDNQHEQNTHRSVADVATPSASKYLQQLCKHFGHKRPATFDERSGEIAFADGVCRLAAENGVLTITVAGPDDARKAQLESVIERHLVRFAFRETLQIAWRAA